MLQSRLDNRIRDAEISSDETFCQAVQTQRPSPVVKNEHTTIQRIEALKKRVLSDLLTNEMGGDPKGLFCMP